MTDEELKNIEARKSAIIRTVRGDEGGEYVSMDWAEEANEDRDALLAEIGRLKGLVKGAEANVRGNCPWCSYAVGDWKRKHAPECPAFHEDGTVR